jgi:hypothetical protein
LMPLLEFIPLPTSQAMSRSLLKSDQTTWSLLVIQTPIKSSPPQTFTRATRWGRPIFAKEGISS